jgi:nucleoid-associated protein YgaU
MFFRGSRYESVPDAVWVDPSGLQIPYKRLRLIPNPGAIQAYRVRSGDRLDLIAFTVYQDPEQFWRICDANRALLPDDLIVRPGRVLRIPLAER